MTSMPMSFAIGATVFSTKAYDRLSADDRKTIDDISKASSRRLRKVIRKANEDSKETMARKGVTIVNTPDAMVADFTKQSQDIWKELVGKIYTQDELDMVIKYRDEYRSKHQ